MSLTLLLCKQSPELKHPSGVAEAETEIGMKSIFPRGCRTISSQRRYSGWTGSLHSSQSA